MATNFPPVHIDPLVGMCMLDRYTKREFKKESESGEVKHAEEVFGWLMGGMVGGVLEVRACFPVKHTKQGDVVNWDVLFQGEMANLHKKIYQKDRAVGWYSSTYDPVVSRGLHEKFSTSLKGVPFVNIIMDCSLTDSTLNPRCLIMSSAKIAGEEMESMFQETPIHWKTRSEVEKIALDTMIQNRHIVLKPVIEGLPETLPTDDLQSCQKKSVRQGISMSTSYGDRQPFEQVHKQLLQVYSVLKKTLDFVTEVVDGKENEDPEIGRELLSLIQSIPPVTPEAFDKLFNSTTQDLLMVNYLSKLTRTQVHLMERLHVYVPDVKPRLREDIPLPPPVATPAAPAAAPAQ